jgi:hypothetical protein
MKETTDFETLPANRKLVEQYLMHTVLVFTCKGRHDFLAVAKTRNFKEIHELGTSLAGHCGSEWENPCYMGYEYNVDLELRNEKAARKDGITLLRCAAESYIDSRYSDCIVLYFEGPYNENFVIVCSYSARHELIDLAYRIQNTAKHMVWDCEPVSVKEHNRVVAIAANIAYELGEKEEAYYEGLRSHRADPAGGD